MSDKVQTLDSIGPMSDAKEASPPDPVQEDYQEGKRYLENKSYGQAAVALHNALVGFEENDDLSGIANACNQLGHLCLAKEEFDNAIQHYDRAQQIVEEMGDLASVAAVKAKKVEAYSAIKDYHQAIALNLDLLDIYHDNRNPQGSVRVLESMADIYQAMGELQKAADAYRTIASIHKNFKHSSIAASYVEKAEELEQK